MKWFSGWWGIGIEAETEEDAALLKQLADTLPERAYSAYEDGVMLYGESAEPYRKDAHVLVFER